MPLIENLETPALILDEIKLERNIRKMADHASKLGIQLRPHLKTPKSVHVASMLAKSGATSFNVSTLAEAEYFFENGFNDLFYCVPFAPDKSARASALIERGCNLTLMTDSLDGAIACTKAAEELESNQPLQFVIEIDVDGYRTGIDLQTQQLEEAAKLLTHSPKTAFAGIMSYAGASYTKSPGDTRRLALRHIEALETAKARLRLIGIGCAMISFGSTPAVLHSEGLPGITEARCGIYAFQDLFQAGIGAARIDDIALSVLATVTSCQTRYNRFVIDAGALALSKDRSTANKPFDAAYGLVCDLAGNVIDDLIVETVSQEIGLVSSKAGNAIDFARFPIGSKVRILPNHADMTAAAYEHYNVVSQDGRVESVWTRKNHWV